MCTNNFITCFFVSGSLFVYSWLFDWSKFKMQAKQQYWYLRCILLFQFTLVYDQTNAFFEAFVLIVFALRDVQLKICYICLLRYSKKGRVSKILKIYWEISKFKIRKAYNGYFRIAYCKTRLGTTFVVILLFMVVGKETCFKLAGFFCVRNDSHHNSISFSTKNCPSTCLFYLF